MIVVDGYPSRASDAALTALYRAEFVRDQREKTYVGHFISLCCAIAGAVMLIAFWAWLLVWMVVGS